MRQELEYYKTELAQHVTSSSATTPAMKDSAALEFLPKCPKASLGQLLNDLIPPVQKYFLWAAQHNSGIYDSYSYKGCEESKNERMYDTVIRRNCKPVPAAANGTTEAPPAIDRALIQATQAKLREITENISVHVKGMLEHKNEILKEVCKLDKVVQQDIFGKMPHGSADAFTKWVEQV